MQISRLCQLIYARCIVSNKKIYIILYKNLKTRFKSRYMYVNALNVMFMGVLMDYHTFSNNQFSEFNLFLRNTRYAYVV